MKKRSVVCLILLVLLAGCAKQRTAASFAPKRSFTAAFSIQNETVPMAGTLRVTAYDDMRMTFTSPEALTHCALTLTPEGCKMDIAGMGAEAAAWEIPQDAPVILLGEALRAAIFEQQSFTRDQNGDYAVRLLLSGGVADVTFAPDGTLRELRTDEGLTVCFTMQP